MAANTEIDIPFTAGLEQATRDEARDPMAGFATLENAIQRKRGAYTKRTGYANVASHGGTGLATLASHRDEALIAIDGTQLHAHSKTGDRWSTRGRMPGLSVERFGLASSGIFRGSVVYDCVHCNGYLVLMYETPRALFAVVLDADTKAPVLGPSKLASGLSGADAIQEFRATLVVVGNSVVCLYNREDVVLSTREDALKYTVIDTTDLNSGWTASADLIGPGIIDITPSEFLFDAIGLTTCFALLYKTVALNLVLSTYDTTGTLVATAAAFSGAAGTTYSFSVDGIESDTLWISRCQTGTNPVGVEAHSPTTLAVTGTAIYTAFPNQLTGSESSEQIAYSSMVRTGAATAKLVVSGATTSAGDYSRHWVGWQDIIISAGAVARSGNASVAQHLEATHKPWNRNGRTYVMACPFDDFDAALVSAPIELASATNRQRCLYALDVTDVRLGDVLPMANIAPRVVGERGMLYFPRYQRQLAEFSDGKRAVVFPSLRSGSSETFELAEMSPVTTCGTAELAGLLHASGGLAWSYDGSKPFEVAFVQAPRVKAHTSTGTGLTGTYLYSAVWEHEDAAGNSHYSEPATPISITVVNQTPRVRITTPSATLRDARSDGADSIRCVLYRTTNGGSTYYRVDEQRAYDTASTCQSAFIQFSDTMLDATLTQRSRLYTQPGTIGTAMPRRAPPALRHLVQHGDALAGIADDRRTIWFSAPVVGGEGPWFNDLFVVEVNDTTPLVGLASFDGRLWAFTRSGIWVIDGAGYLENGTGGYSLPVRVPVDVGCIDARSIVVTPQGAMFQSELGIALLSRSGQVQFFGEAVGDTLASYPICSSAVLEPSENHVIFTLRNASSVGRALVYDYLSGVWTTERRTTDTAADSACMVAGVYHRGLATAIVKRAAATYLDATQWQGQTIETGWIKSSGMQGFQRVRRATVLFRRRTDAGLRVSFAFDYSDTYTEVRTFTPADVVAANGQFEVGPSRQRCQAIRVKLEEIEPAAPDLGAGQGLEFLGLRLTVTLAASGRAASQKD